MSKHSSQESHFPDIEFIKEQDTHAGAESDCQWHAKAEESQRHLVVASKHSQVNTGCVSVEHKDES